MTTVYSPQIDLALRLIAAKGQGIILHKVIADEYDLVTDTPNTVPPHQCGGFAVVLPPDTMTEQSYASQFASGDLIRSRTRKLLIAAKDLVFSPVEGDLVEFEGIMWTFIGVKTMAPDGTPIYFEGIVKQ